MQGDKMQDYIKAVLENMPMDWLNLTTHRLDIYEEKLAKAQFLDRFENLSNSNNSNGAKLSELPTAYDYVRLGHPLSCVLEWIVAKQRHLAPENVISFSSKTIPVLSILRKNLFDKKKTQILYSGELPECFDVEKIKKVYGYNFDLKKVDKAEEVSAFDGTNIFMIQQDDIFNIDLNNSSIDFFVSIHQKFGSIILANGTGYENYTKEIQHVRRRETIAMTPATCYEILNTFVGKSSTVGDSIKNQEANRMKVRKLINEITGANTKPLLASCGLSTQYAIMMGLVDDAHQNHPGKSVRFIVPPNCYGGTNDQARRVAACLDHVTVVDLPVDGGNDMVQSIDKVLDQIASEDAVPYIIAEIPTNPRVEVPDLIKLRNVLSKIRQTAAGKTAIDPVFVLDQTFCPNKHFLGEDAILSTTRTISYVSGSKFPSGGKCTAGYCIANKNAEPLIGKIEEHLKLCNNEATDFQCEILATQMPSMLQRIHDAYKNTREFVEYIKETLPTAKINFVSEALAEQGFTPSVFSLDLPTKGNSEEEKEAYKRAQNLKLINLMIGQIPDESKFCVSYGQLKGCYWTIPATTTQGTTKEGDKDYIVRVSFSANLNVELHKKVFLDFVKSI